MIKGSNMDLVPYK